MEVALDPVSRDHMRRAREAGLEILESNPRMRVYGWNQALGPFKDRRLEPEEQLRFQVNVLRSHSTGLGEELPRRVSRLALIIRANCLARGTSGARPELVERMNDAVNLGLIPVLPGTGSMGTGDLQPMAAAGLALTGDVAGRVRGDDGEEHQPQPLHQLAKHQLLQRVQRQPLLKHQLQLQTTLAKQVAVHILSKPVTPCTQSLVVMG